MHDRCVRAGLLLTTALLACTPPTSSDGGATPSNRDASVPPMPDAAMAQGDAGAGIDAHANDDAAVPPDAGLQDAGGMLDGAAPALDAALPADAAIAPDAATAPDAAALLDAAVPPDAASTGDAGLTMDAGSRDAAGPPDASAVPLSALPGPAGEPAARNLPWVDYDPAATLFVPHPELPGYLVSTNTFIAVLAPGVPVGSFNAMLMQIGAQVVGTMVPVSATGRGVVILRTASSTAQQGAADVAAALASNTVTTAVPDTVVTANRVEGPVRRLNVGNGGVLWGWEPQPPTRVWPDDDMTWALDYLSVPAAWNALVQPHMAARETIIGVVDVGFSGGHPDLPNLTIGETNPAGTPTDDADHGNHVAGILGAAFGNHLGIEGVVPNAKLVGLPILGSRGPLVPVTGWRSWGYAAQRNYLAVSFFHARVVNNAWGELGSQDAGCAATGPCHARDLAASTVFINGIREKAEVLSAVMDDLAELKAMYVFGAGNNYGDAPANLSSAGCYAAVTLNRADTYCVEALDRDGTRAAYSNEGGTHSAPGSGIISTISNGAYGLDSGTSMATPYLAGVIALLLTVEPSLTAAEVRALVDHQQSRILPPTGLPYSVNAYEAVLLTDLRNASAGNTMLRLLADVDDGTLDGNTRVWPDGTPVDRFSHVGDGLVDIKDFRVLRDLLLSLSGGLVSLDGPFESPPNDANLNGEVSYFEGENVWPILDLNGDSRLDHQRVMVRPFGEVLSDLDVFKRVYADGDVPLDELETLLTSGDVHFDMAPCLERDPTITSMETVVYFPGGSDVYRSLRRVNLQAPVNIETVASGTPWEAWVREESASRSGWRFLSTFTVQPGEDVRISTCGDVGVLACTNISDLGFLDNDCSVGAPSDAQNGLLMAEAARSSAISTREAFAEINEHGVCIRLSVDVTLPAIRALGQVAVAVFPQAFMAPPTSFVVTPGLGYVGLDSESELFLEVLAADGSSLGSIDVYYSAADAAPVWRIRNNGMWVAPSSGSAAGEFDLDLGSQETVVFNVMALGSNFNERVTGNAHMNAVVEFPFGACDPPEP